MFKPKILSYAASALEQDVKKPIEEKNGNKLIGTALRHYAELVSLADGLLRQAGLWRSARDGEDIVQDVLLQIIKFFHDGEGQEMRGGEQIYLYYIKGALRNKVKDLAKKTIEKRQKPSDLSDNVSSGLFEAESILYREPETSLEDQILAKQLYRYIFYGKEIGGIRFPGRGGKSYKMNLRALDLYLSQTMSSAEIAHELPKEGFLEEYDLTSPEGEQRAANLIRKNIHVFLGYIAKTLEKKIFFREPLKNHKHPLHAGVYKSSFILKEHVKGFSSPVRAARR